jgi:PIF1-like helicase/Helix-turn-helix domain/HRDC domain/Helicase
VATIIPDTSNILFRLAVELVNQSSRNIFLTGKAGTGKTTFLKYIRQSCPKQLAVIAPTGVAAINAGGTTIHSFFQLPFSPFLPEAKGFSKSNDETVNPNSLTSRLRFTKEKIKVLQQLELLIIDEISMVRCDIPDAIDTVLRHVRKRPYEKFGGVQVLFIGDMFQLPPVVKEPEWKMLSEFYESPYFFSSRVIREELPVKIEFNKIYRQSEERFIKVLNQVRNNELDEEGMKILESRYQPGFRRSEGDGYILLTTHNESAKNTNARELVKLENRSFTYKAEIQGDFPENSYPADELLQLKSGAQVMFIKNDGDKSKRYFNGKIGVITELNDEKIIVQCKDDPTTIEVSKEKWDNIRYTLNKTSRQMEEEILGSFTQYPLRLAWAITIHKSQGLTFEKAIIDAGEAFAPGQVYVALSRCTSLEGMILQSKIRSNSFFSDKRIVAFSQSYSSSDQLQGELALARKHYQEKLLLTSFDFGVTIDNIKELQKYVGDNVGSFNRETTGPWIEELSQNINKLQDTANKFQKWLQGQFSLPGPAEENAALQERIVKAAAHFVKELDQQIAFLQRSPAITDSRLHAKEYNDSLNSIFAELAAQRFLFRGLNGIFDTETWHQRRKEFVLPAFSSNAYAGTSAQNADSPHPLLHRQLRKLRDTICSKKDLPIYIIAGTKTIDEMARYLPQSLTELRRISGFGDAKVEQYGQQFLDVILEYSREHNLSSLIEEKLPKRERKQTNVEKKPKVDTKAESLKLYKEGMTITEIAAARSFAIQTIEGHLAHYISIGEIGIEELVSQEKIVQIKPAIKDFEGGPITRIKEKLGSEIGFGEIKLMLAWQEFENRNTKSE